MASVITKPTHESRFYYVTIQRRPGKPPHKFKVDGKDWVIECDEIRLKLSPLELEKYKTELVAWGNE